MATNEDKLDHSDSQCPEVESKHCPVSDSTSDETCKTASSKSISPDNVNEPQHGMMEEEQALCKETAVVSDRVVEGEREDANRDALMQTSIEMDEQSDKGVAPRAENEKDVASADGEDRVASPTNGVQAAPEEQDAGIDNGQDVQVSRQDENEDGTTREAAQTVGDGLAHQDEGVMATTPPADAEEGVAPTSDIVGVAAETESVEGPSADSVEGVAPQESGSHDVMHKGEGAVPDDVNEEKGRVPVVGEIPLLELQAEQPSQQKEVAVSDAAAPPCDDRQTTAAVSMTEEPGADSERISPTSAAENKDTVQEKTELTEEPPVEESKEAQQTKMAEFGGTLSSVVGIEGEERVKEKESDESMDVVPAQETVEEIDADISVPCASDAAHVDAGVKQGDNNEQGLTQMETENEVVEQMQLSDDDGAKTTLQDGEGSSQIIDKDGKEKGRSPCSKVESEVKESLNESETSRKNSDVGSKDDAAVSTTSDNAMETEQMTTELVSPPRDGLEIGNETGEQLDTSEVGMETENATDPSEDRNEIGNETAEQLPPSEPGMETGNVTSEQPCPSKTELELENLQHDITPSGGVASTETRSQDETVSEIEVSEKEMSSLTVSETEPDKPVEPESSPRDGEDSLYVSVQSSERQEEVTVKEKEAVEEGGEEEDEERRKKEEEETSLLEGTVDTTVASVGQTVVKERLQGDWACEGSGKERVEAEGTESVQMQKEEDFVEEGEKLAVETREIESVEKKDEDDTESKLDKQVEPESSADTQVKDVLDKQVEPELGADTQVKAVLDKQVEPELGADTQVKDVLDKQVEPESRADTQVDDVETAEVDKVPVESGQSEEKEQDETTKQETLSEDSASLPANVAESDGGKPDDPMDEAVNDQGQPPMGGTESATKIDSVAPEAVNDQGQPPEGGTESATMIDNVAPEAVDDQGQSPEGGTESATEIDAGHSPTSDKPETADSGIIEPAAGDATEGESPTLTASSQTKDSAMDAEESSASVPGDGAHSVPTASPEADITASPEAENDAPPTSSVQFDTDNVQQAPPTLPRPSAHSLPTSSSTTLSTSHVAITSSAASVSERGPPSLSSLSTLQLTAAPTAPTLPIVSLLGMSSSKTPPTSTLLPPPTSSLPSPPSLQRPSLSTVPSLSTQAAKSLSLTKLLPSFDSSQTPQPLTSKASGVIEPIVSKTTSPPNASPGTTATTELQGAVCVSQSGVDKATPLKATPSIDKSNINSVSVTAVSKPVAMTMTSSASITTNTTVPQSTLFVARQPGGVSMATGTTSTSATSTLSAVLLSPSIAPPPLRESQAVTKPPQLANPVSVITQLQTASSKTPPSQMATSKTPPSQTATSKTPPTQTALLKTPPSQMASSKTPPSSAIPITGQYVLMSGALSREQNIILGRGAEKLKVGEAEVLQVSGEPGLQLQQQKIEVKSREEMMGKVPPQVAVIPPIIDLTRTPEYSQVEKLKGRVSGEGVKVKSQSILVGVAGSSESTLQRSSSNDLAGQDLKGHIAAAEMKASHPVARRIWMSSCRPLDPASLERIGVDSKGTVYWYDGGKNMFQSPPSNDPAYKPSESELQLSCKSMVQWTAKLKDLRHSNVEADMKLAQTIKDQFLSRVRVATQRKPRDVSVIQKLQAVHSLRQPAQMSQQQQNVSTKPTITIATSQIANAGVAGAIAMATAGGDNVATQKTAQIIQGNFPQGSILVVPHPTHPFQAVLPVFANTAVLMPQAAAATATAGSHVTPSSAAVSVTQPQSESPSSERKASVSVDEATAKARGPSMAAPATVVQAQSTTQTLTSLQASPSAVVQLSASVGKSPAVGGGGAVGVSEKMKESSNTVKDQSPSSSSKAQQQQQQVELHLQQAQKTAGIAVMQSPQGTPIAIHPSFLPQALASGMLTAAPGGGFKFQDYRQALALSAGLPMQVPVMAVKVEEPVKLGTIDFESQSIEITGEVPIKKVTVDEETGELVPVPKDAVDVDSQEKEKNKSEKLVAPTCASASLGDDGSKEKATDEETHVDVEEGTSGATDGAKPDAPPKAPVKESVEGGGAFSGHSSRDILSAQLLLSLTGGPHNSNWSSTAAPNSEPPHGKSSDSPVKALLNNKEASIALTPVALKSSGRDETASPASSTSQTTVSGGRKRKQKPIASAKPGDEGIETSSSPTVGVASTATPASKGRKGGRKAAKPADQESGEVENASSEPPKPSARKRQTNNKTGEKETPGRLKQLSPEEILILLDIPPSSGSGGGSVKASSKTKTPAAKLKGKGKDKPNQDGRSVLQSSNATAKMEQLKASRAEKPMKEYVIETDSDSDSSSSGTSSSRFSPDSGSSSESSSDSSSEEGGERDSGEAKVKPPPKKVPARASKGGVARGRGGRGARGGRAQRKGKKEEEESSSADSSSDNDEEGESTKTKKKPARGGRVAGRGGGRGSGRGGRGAVRQETKPVKRQRGGHIVSIPTNLLSHKPVSGKKRKATAREAEVDKPVAADLISDLPVDIATLYATKGGVDLGTLSELTNSVKEDGLSGQETEMGVSRSKRTCVRMREEISKLQEILRDSGSPEVKPSPPARSRGRGKGRSSSGRTSDVGGGVQESPSTSVPSAPARKYRRSGYSQFTHKRRKRRKKQPEEEALWQPANRGGEPYKAVYLFSTFLANKAAAAVEKNRYNTIIQFHQAQPKDPGFLRLPPPAEKQTKPPQRGSVSDRKQTDGESAEEDITAKETKSAPRGAKRRSSGRGGGGEGGMPSTTRRTRNSEVEALEKVPSPQPFLRSSRRLRQQRNRSITSPPLQSPSSTDGPKSPLPPSPPTGVRPRPRKASQTTPSGGAGGESASQPQQRSLRRKRGNQREESPVASPLPDLFKSRASQEVEEMDSPSDDDEKRQRDENEGASDGEVGARKKARLDTNEAESNVIPSPSIQSPEQQPSIPAPNSREEENYTICHGTPVNKSVAGGNDISSPKSWPHPPPPPQQQQGQYQLHPQGHASQQHHAHQTHPQLQQQYEAGGGRHHQHATPTSEAVTFSPPMGQLHPGSSSSPVGSQFDHRSSPHTALTAGGATTAGMGTSGRSIQAEYAHRQHLMSAEHAHQRESGSGWSAAAAAAATGLHPQFAGVPGAYPGGYPHMYGHAGIPGMPYSGQPMPSANYPYPMPYHWGHPHPSAAAAIPQFGPHGDHMIQQQQHRQAAASSKEVQSHQEVLQHPHIGGHTPGEPPHSASLLMRGQHASGTSSTQSINATSSSTAAGKASSRGHYHSPSLHQLAAPGSGSPHALSHQVPHGGVGAAEHHLPPGHHQAAAFPYGFDSSTHSLTHMHMLQQSQMQPTQIRSLPGIPPHHLPPHMASRGLWYAPQHMAPHQMIPGAGGEIPGHPAHSKKTAKGSKSADLDKNRNANNNSEMSTIPHSSPFSISRLAAPYGGAHLVGVSATPTSGQQRFNGDHQEEGSLPAVSVILERTL